MSESPTIRIVKGTRVQAMKPHTPQDPGTSRDSQGPERSQTARSGASRLMSMLRLDFYRLFHTPILYIMLCVSALIPALIMSTSGSSTAGAGQAAKSIVYTNVFQVVAPHAPQYVVTDFGQYATINMVYIFAGILLSIFIGHDYMSGFVKNVFAVHANKRDYVVSKIAIGTFSTFGMIVMYLIGAIASGLLAGKSFGVDMGGLVLCLIAKAVLAAGFSALFTTLNVLFRRMMGLSIVGCFLFGTGMLVMGLAAVLATFGKEWLMGVFLYGAASSASLSATPLTVVACLACSLVWAFIYTQLSTFILTHRDLA